MLAWMDDEAERRTRESGEAWFWSRSRAGVLAQGRDLGQHARGRASCATTATATRCCCASTPPGPPATPARSRASRPALWRTIAERALERPRGLVHDARCSSRGSPAVARKVGEEAVEVVTAALAESDERVVSEAADLVYHLYVLLAARGIDLAAVEDELAARSR